MNYPDDRQVNKASAVETIVVLAIATAICVGVVEVVIRVACKVVAQ